MMVSIIIVNYNNSSLLKRCIESIIDKTREVNYEIIVYDNASTDNSVEMLKTHFKNVRVIESQCNVGYGKANNIAAQIAKGEFYLFLNNDTELRNNAIKILTDFMLNNEKCGICGGNLYDFTLKPLHSYGLKYQTPFSELYRFYPRLIRVFQGKNWEYNWTGKPLQVSYITGADMMIRSQIFHKVKGFDPDFFLYYEESELAYRVKKLGYTIWSVPEAKIKHLKGASLRFIENSRKTVFLSKYLYLKKIYGKSGMMISRIIYIIYCIIKICYFSILTSTDRYKKYKLYLKYDEEAFLRVVR